MNKTFQLEIKEIKDEENNRQVTFIASDESVDRDQDVIMSSGWDYKNFVKSGSIIYGHDPREKLPVAKPIDVRIANKQLLITAKFAEQGTSDFNDAVYSLVKQGILKGVSVGFQALEHKPNDHGGRTFSKQELLELSLTPIPANANARVLVKEFSEEVQDKLLDNETIKKEKLVNEIVDIVTKRLTEEVLEKEEEVQEEAVAEPEPKTLSEKEEKFIKMVKQLKSIGE